ncbi:unnamed protein product [Bursaphelenchus okinawaensis]|uniref:BHLH domain-containing protein n=1 Tax=Bursaphelenchus okinawaensis TaxID=465554 RepID=A0A811LID7_9BILA|nr:unnamed protein product [Bursaphelenchus okinawaensis]CAG9124294.1 unnamed protein product [Bursaphelenchus okinawaensis]
MVLQTSSAMSPAFQPAPAGYRKRKLHSHETSSDNDFSDDDESPKSGSPSVDEDRRAHHNELERRRRDHIKDHFMALKGSIPLLEGEKSSRALILKRAVDYIKMLQSQVKDTKTEVEDLKRRNETLLQQNSLKPFLGQLQLQPTSLFSGQATVPVSLCVPSTSALPQLQEQVLASNVQNLKAGYVKNGYGGQNVNLAGQAALVNQSNGLVQSTGLVNQPMAGQNQVLPPQPSAAFKPSYPTPDPVSPTPMASTSTSSNNLSPSNLSPSLGNLSPGLSNLSANLSSLLLQNPNLLVQLQSQQLQQSQMSQQNTTSQQFEPLTPPHSATQTVYSDVITPQLLASSLAIRERQFAAVAAAQL